MKALIAFGTSLGAASEIAGEIAKVLRQASFNTDVINVRERKIGDISNYELVVLGSEVHMDKWVSEAEDFLKDFLEELAHRKVAIFVSAALAPLDKIQGKKEDIDSAEEKYLTQKAAAYSLKPIATAMFGGIIDFNKMGFFARRTLGWAKASLEEAGYKEKKPGVYDTRNWKEIKDWARKLVLKARYL
jgi:menaquinone-dependent protoporphyrinogen IX oxidase